MWCQYGCSTVEDVDAHGHLVTMDALTVELLLHSDMVLMLHYGCPLGGMASAQRLC